jgi:hypothetical protein
LQKLFLDCKVFNTSVENFVEIKAAASPNFLQFNILPRIALFVCNIGPLLHPPPRTLGRRSPSHQLKIGMPSQQGSRVCDQNNKIAQEVRHIAREADAVRQTLS